MKKFITTAIIVAGLSACGSSGSGSSTSDSEFADALWFDQMTAEEREEACDGLVFVSKNDIVTELSTGDNAFTVDQAEAFYKVYKSEC